jgi:hypothetical protein
MKYGKFVSRQNIAMSESEVKMFEDAINDAFYNSSIQIQYIRNIMAHINTGYLIYDRHKMDIGCKFHLIPCCGRTMIGRNYKGDKVLFNGMDINIKKEVGYLEENGMPTNKCIEQYSMQIEFPDSRFIEYNCRSRTKIWLRDGYFFGTEIEDFDLYELRRQVDRVLNFVRITDGQLRKVVESLTA